LQDGVDFVFTDKETLQIGIGAGVLARLSFPFQPAICSF
jgi:hypothetical protein